MVCIAGTPTEFDPKRAKGVIEIILSEGLSGVTDEVTMLEALDLAHYIVGDWRDYQENGGGNGGRKWEDGKLIPTTVDGRAFHFIEIGLAALGAARELLYGRDVDPGDVEAIKERISWDAPVPLLTDAELEDRQLPPRV